MTDVTFIDIETVRDETVPESLMTSMYEEVEVKADGRLKDPDAIQADYQKKYSTAIDKINSRLGLSPMTGKICCVGWWKADSPTRSSSLNYQSLLPESFESEIEIDVLNKIAEILNGSSQLTTLVTFNGKSFDIPFIRIRCALNNISLIRPIRDTKYDLDHHFDVRSALTNFDNYKEGTLSQWALRFGLINNLPTIDGADIQKLYDFKDLDTIGLKCRDDVQLTGRIYERIFRYF